jgi:hypothetical protein
MQEVASHALATMMNHMGNYPNPSGTTCLSTLLNEEDVLKLLPDEVPGKIDPSQFIRYFISGSTVYTVIDRPNSGGAFIERTAPSTTRRCLGLTDSLIACVS